LEASPIEKWLEVSFTLDNELAEAVADLLSRYSPRGVAISSLIHPSDTTSDIFPNVVDVRAYLAVDENLEMKQAGIEEGLWHLGQIMPIPDPSYRFLEDEDWQDAWREHYKPIVVGRRLLVLPAWIPPPEGDRLPIILDPGMAFGTGTHPSTRLCLMALDKYLQPGQVVVDLGCGSGILTIAAAHLGASKVLALDTDRQAVQITRENLKRNHISDHVNTYVGSLPELQSAIRDQGLMAHIIVANILAPTLEKMIMAGLAEMVHPRGTLILSGILAGQTESMVKLCEQFGLTVFDILSEEDWRALLLQHK
jgi:ribosomal protein L11 methyltransferase